ncbi:MAG: hypothetical protein U0169_25725 [Polyangiaceae bacterium]
MATEDDELLDRERRRIVRERVRHADAGRRSWPVVAQVVIANLLFALAPAVPGARHLLGDLTVGRMLLLIAPGSLMTIVSAIAWRKRGGDDRVYVGCERVESALLFAINVGSVYGTNLDWPVVWILVPFTAVFWATTKPFEAPVYLAILGAAHGLLAWAQLERGDPGRAGIASGVGAFAGATLWLMARSVRKDVALEAERDLATRRLDEATLDQARRDVATALREGIGRDIEALAQKLGARSPGEGPDVDVDLVARATESIDELGASRGAGARTTRPTPVKELKERIDARCGPLCAGTIYESSLDGEGPNLATCVGAEEAAAVVLVAQELVRNAVLHGRAEEILVRLDIDGSTLTLAVVDDGVGLTAEAFENATGGLHNAVAWLREHGGTLERRANERGDGGTLIEARLPLTPYGTPS